MNTNANGDVKEAFLLFGQMVWLAVRVVGFVMGVLLCIPLLLFSPASGIYFIGRVGDYQQQSDRIDRRMRVLRERMHGRTVSHE